MIREQDIQICILNGGFYTAINPCDCDLLTNKLILSQQIDQIILISNTKKKESLIYLQKSVLKIQFLNQMKHSCFSKIFFCCCRLKCCMKQKCLRHFSALTRKNFILWARAPCCSTFEILAPVVLMVILTIIRNQVPTTPVDQEGMFKKKYIVYPGVPAQALGEWYHDKHYNSRLDPLISPLTCYADYFERADPDICQDYDAGNDWHGPQFFAPTQCLKTYSWNKPKISSPLIAVIGDQSDITDSYGNFYVSLRKFQFATAAAPAVPYYKPNHFETVEEFNDYIASPDYQTKKNKGVCMGLQIKNEVENDYQISIHLPDKKIGVSKLSYSQAIPSQTNPVWEPQAAAPDLLSYLRYQHNGFSFLQNLIAQQLLAFKKQDYLAMIAMILQPMQTDTSIYDPLAQGIGLLLPLFLLLAFIPPVYNMTFKIVREKETRAKETMRIMGMTDFPYWFSWFFFYTTINLIVSTLAWFTLLFKVINYSQPAYLLIFFFLYGQAVFGQIIFLQSMFTGSKYAGIVSTIIYFCGVLVNKLIMEDGVPRSSKLFASLLPQVALMQGSLQFANYEGTGVGLDASTANVIYQEYSFNTALWMLLLDFFIYFLLGLYLDKVIPSDFGQRLNPCFLCMPSYYSCCRRSNRRGANNASQVQQSANTELLDESDHFEMNQMPQENYEAPPVICKRLESSGDYLRVQNLQKTYGGGFRAVRGVNVKMYDSQIFALLGHNGAGKTTAISMLTGLIKKSQGNATVYGVDLFEQMDDVREFMGVCPQHDVLFEKLTPREHLDIFYDFKGGDPNRKDDEIESLITDVGLTIDSHKQAGTLSGGNKRKLSVSLALCGGSRFVLLDEPTSGMDLGARRNLWDMLKSYKKDRIIVLTTHYMDEADVLGDRIGIMCKGTMQCLGSSLFLKNRFGIGYKITFVKKRRRSHPGLEKFLQTYFSGIQKANEVHEEISFVIPKSQAQNFGGFFEALDQRLEEYDIRSYGVSMSNLEDVFLKINQEFAPDLFGDLQNFSASQSMNAELEQSKGANEGRDTYAKSIGHSTFKSSTQDKDKANDDSHNSSCDESNDYEVEIDGGAENLIRGSSCVRSCTASTAKRLTIYKRDWCGLLCQIVIPLILVLFGLWLTSGPSKLAQSPPRHMSTGWWPQKQRILMNPMPVNMTNDGGDVSGAELFAMLPNSTTAFEVTYIDTANYTDFYNKVYEARNDAPLFPYRYGSYSIYQANKNSNQYTFVNYINVTSQDVTGLYPQYMLQAILRVAFDDPNMNFDVTSTPYPIYNKFIEIEEAGKAYDFVFMTAIAMALIPCVMIQFILHERECQLKHQQLLSGMSLAGYWGSNVIFDMIMAYIPVMLIILLTFLFDKMYPGVWLLFLLYPLAIVPYTYVWSFAFISDINAQIFTLFIHFITGGLGCIIVFLLQFMPVTMKAGNILRWALTIFPTFCVTHGILMSASGKLLVDATSQKETQDGQVIPQKIPADIWAWYNLKGDCIILLLHCIFGLLILTLIELEVYNLIDFWPLVGYRSNNSNRTGPPLIKDDDVIAEERRVATQSDDYQSMVQNQNSMAEQERHLLDSNASSNDKNNPDHRDCIRVHNFQKEYNTVFGAPVKAVQQASFGLDYGECFALLGVNGAGKSTTFKSLTRDITPTTGEITVQGYNVQSQFQDARKLIGYCPQYDAIFPKLTVEETLKFYALVKGIRTHKIRGVIEKAIRDLNLKDHRNKLAGTLSGGNKRKLSVAMALIGNPPIILLDEPSAGMDPEARRFMWQVVEKISQRDKKSAVILTTHSMEEAEALSTKLGIMVRGGVFRCFGSSQHIKNKFGVGYEIEIKVKKSNFQDQEEMAQQLGFKVDIQDKVNLRGAIDQLQANQFDHLILDQIRQDGLGADILLESTLDPQGEVRLTNLLQFLRAQTYGFRILVYLTRHFEKVEILEQCGEFFKLRVPKEDKTIGWLFGRLEHEKRGLGIEEYSVSQTTLEQIFQNFASQSIASDKAAFTFRQHGDTILLMNPDRKMTEEQERLSQRGLSFHENDRLITNPPLLKNNNNGSEIDEENKVDNSDDNKKTTDNQLLLPAQKIEVEKEGSSDDRNDSH